MVEEVSLVDRPATGETFAVTKRDAEGDTASEEETMLTAEDIKKAVAEAVSVELATLVAKAAASDAALAAVSAQLEEVTKAFDMHKALMAEAADAAKAQVDVVAKLAEAGAEWSDLWDAKDKVYSFLNKLTGYAEVAGAGNSMEMAEVAKAAPPAREDTLVGVTKALSDVAAKTEALEAVVKSAVDAKVAAEGKIAELEDKVSKAESAKTELQAKVTALEMAPVSKAFGSDATPEDVKKADLWSSVIKVNR
jgi:chromosome segregation ATPase